MVLILLLLVPQTVVIHQKPPLQLGQLIFAEIPPQQIPVDALGGEHRHLLAALAEKLLRHGHRALIPAGILQLREDALHRHIAGQVPQLRRLTPLLGQVAQHAVENHMQVRPVGQHPGPEVPLRQPAAAVIEGLAVCCDGERHLISRRKTKSEPNQLLKRQTHIKFDPCREED